MDGLDFVNMGDGTVVLLPGKAKWLMPSQPRILTSFAKDIKDRPILDGDTVRMLQDNKPKWFAGTEIKIEEGAHGIMIRYEDPDIGESIDCPWEHFDGKCEIIKRRYKLIELKPSEESERL